MGDRWDGVRRLHRAEQEPVGLGGESVLGRRRWVQNALFDPLLFENDSSIMLLHNDIFAVGGCPWLHYAQPGDKEPQNRFMPAWQQRRLATSRNRCNSDVRPDHPDDH